MIIGFVPAIIGIILGIVSLAQKNEKKGLTIAGLILSFLALIVMIGMMAFLTEQSNTVSSNLNSTSIDSKKEVTSKPSNNKLEIVVADFSLMQKSEIEAWCDTNKIKCSINQEYSDTVEKGAFISQSIATGDIIYEGDKLTITYSLGKEPSTEYKNALKKAESYAKNMNMSKKSIYNQLTSEYGENFKADAAQYAIDHLED